MREEGYYWVKISKRSPWTTARYIKTIKTFYIPVLSKPYVESELFLINETRIKNPLEGE